MTRTETLRTLFAASFLAMAASPVYAEDMVPGGSEASTYTVPAPSVAPAPQPVESAAPDYAPAPAAVPATSAQPQMQHYLPANPYAQQNVPQPTMKKYVVPKMQSQQQAQTPAPVDPKQTPQQALTGEPALPAPAAAAIPDQSSDGMHAITNGSIKYITGGIGDEERDALAAVKNDYNLHITSTNKDGEFNGDTKLTIIDHSGEKLINVDAGPLFYAQLPAGTYTLQATNSGVEKQQKVTVGGKKDSRVYFRW